MDSYIHAFKLKVHTIEFSHMLVQEATHLAIFMPLHHVGGCVDKI